jgi:hypothetical protein
MTKTELINIMQSDNALWGQATQSPGPSPGSVDMTLDMPFGIGAYTVTMEGMNDAAGKRNALGAFGAHIRDVVNNQINDESITSRAKVKAAQAKQSDSGDSASLSGGERLRDAQVYEEVEEAAEGTHEGDAEEPFDWRDGLTARRATLEGRRERLTSELTRTSRDIKGIDAALEAMK